MPTALVRQASVYVLAAPAAVAKVRQAAIYVLVEPQATAPKGVTGEDGLLALINKVTSVVLDFNKISLGNPIEVSGQERNTQIAVLGKVSGGYSGSYNVLFNRLPIAQGVAPGSHIAANTVTKVHDLIGLLNTASGMVLTARDLVNDTITAGQTDITLTAASTSLFFVPGSTVAITAG